MDFIASMNRDLLVASLKNIRPMIGVSTENGAI
jgi:hypothetical protein